MSRLNVRWRLTLWYGVVISAVVALFGATVYGMMHRYLLERTDFELDEELTELALEVQFATDRQDLQKQLQRRFSHHNTFDFQVCTLDGQPIFRSERVSETVLQVPNDDQWRDGSATVLETVEIDRLGEVRIASRQAKGRDGPLLIQTIIPHPSNREELGALLKTLLATGPLVILAALAGGYFLARNSLAPVDQMVSTAKRITASRLSERIAVSNPDDELGRLAKTLNAMMDRLQRAVDEMRRFTADAAHELRTPLTVLQTEVEVALRMPRSADEYRRVIETTLAESKRLTRLANQLLTLCRHDSGLHPRQFEDVPIDALIRDVVEQVRTAAEEKQVTLQVAPLNEHIVEGDDVQLSQLLFNVLDNAVKFTPPGGTITVRCESQYEQVHVMISDTGVGISPVDLPHLFERFYQADKSRGDKSGGTGLGLAISLAVAEAHGGAIEIECGPKQGTRVKITLPLLPSKLRKSLD